MNARHPLWNKKHTWECAYLCVSFPLTVVEEIILPSVALIDNFTLRRTAEEVAT